MFIDRVINAKQFLVSTHENDILLDNNAILQQDLIDARVLLVDNVAEYYYITSKKDHWNPEEDFYNITPPWPIIWFEWSPKEIINSATYGIIPNEHYGIISKYGLLLMAHDSSKEMNSQYLNHSLSRWWVICKCFYEVDKTILMAPGMPIFYIGKDGHFLKLMPNGQLAVRKVSKYVSEKSLIERMNEMIPSFLHISFLSLCFTHCKNVGLTENKPALQMQKKSINTGKHPFAKYYVLEIDPMKKILNSKGKAQETGLKKAMHICRGHFATYGDEAPLFGKHVGTFWKPMHIRGLAKKGVVAKDYKIGELKAQERRLNCGDDPRSMKDTCSTDCDKRQKPLVSQKEVPGLQEKPRGFWNRLKRLLPGGRC